MGKAHESFGKKETRTKQEKKRKEKEKKRLERKENKGGGSLEDMIAYVDEFSNLTSTPPDPANRKVVNTEDIVIGVPRNQEQDSEESVLRGIVSFFDTTKGFGFIRDLTNRRDIYVHVSDLLEPIRENQEVTFDVAKGPKGFSAKNVKVIRQSQEPIAEKPE